MSQPSLSELFRPFLETRAPLLFLVGSLALAILGNAVYELLTITFGATPEFLIGLVVAAVLIFAFVAVGFQRLVRALDRQGGGAQNQVGADQQAEPHAGLILPVGLNPRGAEVAIVTWHRRGAVLRHCWLLVSPEVARNAKFGDLKQGLLDGGVTPHVVTIDDAIQAGEVYARVRAAIAEARHFADATPLIADITGGTKAMTAGMLLACLEADVPTQYWSTPRDRDGNPRLVEEGCPMKVVVRTVFEETTTYGRAAA
jgi:hypothetical protein